jgi:hypothetical protein
VNIYDSNVEQLIMALSRKTVILLAILVTASATLIPPVTAQGGIDTSNLDIGEAVAPSEVEVGEEIEITSSAAIPSLPADWSAQLEFVAYAGDSQVGSQKVSLQDGESVDVSVGHSFQQTGSKELYFEVTGELTREGAVTEQSATIDRTTSSVAIDVIDTEPTENEDTQEDDESVGDQVEDTTDNLRTDISVEGAVFAAPESTQNEVDDLRENIPVGTDAVSHAFVLATSDGLHLVLTEEEPREGYASIQGNTLNSAEISLPRSGEDNLQLKPIRATAVEYQDPSKASVEEVYQNTDDYRREYVEFTANHRSIALDDEASDYKTTTGILVDEPIRPEDLFGNVGERSSTLLNEVDEGSVGSVLGDRSQPHIVTTAYGTETDYWENTAVTMTGIVASPQSPAGEFIRSQQQYETLPTDAGTPILYITDERYDVEDVSISEISENPTAYEGDTVRFKSNLYMNTISSKRVIESTGTKLPPVDTVLHGGVAWDQLPETRDDLLGVVAASSLTQKQLSSDQSGTYEVTGEVISTDKIEGNLPQGTVLLAYDLERTGRIETASLGEFGEQQSAAISKVLERQANPNIDASTVTSTDEDAGENSSQSANQTDDKADTQSTTSDGETESAEASGSDTSGDTESERVSSVMETVSGIIDRITELFS